MIPEETYLTITQWITYEFGYVIDNPLLISLMWAVIAEIFVGTLAAIKRGDLNSSKGINGIVKHVFTLFCTMLAYKFFVVIGQDQITWLTSVMVGNYGVSIIRNLDTLGVPIPKVIHDKIEMLSKNYSGNNHHNNPQEDAQG